MTLAYYFPVLCEGVALARSIHSLAFIRFYLGLPFLLRLHLPLRLHSSHPR